MSYMQFSNGNDVTVGFAILSAGSAHSAMFKGACSDPQPHPPDFFSNMKILVLEVESYFEGCVCFMHKLCLCSLGDFSQKPSWILENVVSTILQNNK